MELTEKEMYEINGGGISWGLLAGLASTVVFVIGALSGYTNPTKCKNNR